jgi:hypothetical protein
MRSPHKGLRKLRTDRTLCLGFADKGNPAGPHTLLTAEQPAVHEPAISSGGRGCGGGGGGCTLKVEFEQSRPAIHPHTHTYTRTLSRAHRTWC